MAKERIKSADFVRVISFAFIFIFHFYEELEAVTGRQTLLRHQANGNLAVMGNVLFFALSGAMLYLGYGGLTVKSGRKDIVRFYKKRWLSLFPSFLIAWGALYLLKAVASRDLFYNGNPASLLLSLVGLDGYMSYRITDYYIIGEWFLGAMVLIYLLYPVINYFFSKWPVATALGNLLLTGAVWIPGLWKIDTGRNLIVCAFCFVMGMLFMKYQKMICRKVYVNVAAIAALVLFTVPMPNSQYGYELLAFCMMIILFFLGERIMQNRVCDRIFTFLASFAYDVFLVHHIVIYAIQGIFASNSGIMCHVLFVGTGLISILGGFILHKISKGIVNGISKL